MLSTVAVERLGHPQGARHRRSERSPGEFAPRAWGVRPRPASRAAPPSAPPGTRRSPRRSGALVGREARDRGCRGLLAPTVNLHRSPLAGRNFECYSEDPLLSGRLAAGYVRGVQSEGVFATVKHFVGNEAEFERASISSVIDERSLRELYLAALRDRRPRGRRTRHHDGVQPAQRALADPAAASSSSTSCATSGASRVW